MFVTRAAQTSKMVVVVNTTAALQRGQRALMAGRAIIGAYKQASNYEQRQYSFAGQQKVTLKTTEIAPILNAARELNLPFNCVQNEDADTVMVAIGPAPCSDIDSISGHLKLY